MAHRKIDVDALDQDQFMDDEDLALMPSRGQDEAEEATQSVQLTNMDFRQPLSEADASQSVEARAADVRQFLNKGDIVRAVLRALEDPPSGRLSAAIKDKNAAVVVEALQAAKVTDMQQIVKSMGVDQVDILMKYIYRGLASPEQFNSGILLQWHEKVLEVGGVGSIVRVLTDRKTV